MEFIPESVLDVLNDFEKKSSEIPQVLESYLLKIAENGDIIFPWAKLKPLLKRKLELVLDDFHETCPLEITTPVPNFEAFDFDDLKKTILQAVDAFTSAPFTIQRICELITNPKKHYNRTDKYMRGIEKNVLVISTIEARLVSQEEDAQPPPNAMVNGMDNSPSDSDGNCYNGQDKTSDSLAPDSANSPANRVLLENFANVFPSAACIPSPSNIGVDSTFMENTVCVETLEVISETTVFDTTESPEVKPGEFVEVTAMEQDFADDPNECVMEEVSEENCMSSFSDSSDGSQQSSDGNQSPDVSCNLSSAALRVNDIEKASIDADTCDMNTDQRVSPIENFVGESIDNCVHPKTESEVIIKNDNEQNITQDQISKPITEEVNEYEQVVECESESVSVEECVDEIVKECESEQEVVKETQSDPVIVEERASEQSIKVESTRNMLELGAFPERKVDTVECNLRNPDMNYEAIAAVNNGDGNEQRDTTIEPNDLIDEKLKNGAGIEVKIKLDQCGDHRSDFNCPQDNTISQSDDNMSDKVGNKVEQKKLASLETSEEISVEPFESVVSTSENS